MEEKNQLLFNLNENYETTIEKIFCDDIYQVIITSEVINQNIIEMCQALLPYFKNKEEYEKCQILNNIIKKNKYSECK